MGKIKTNDNGKVCRGRGGTDPITDCLGSENGEAALIKRVFQSVKHGSPLWPKTPLLDICPEERKTFVHRENICPCVFKAATIHRSQSGHSTDVRRLTKTVCPRDGVVFSHEKGVGC